MSGCERSSRTALHGAVATRIRRALRTIDALDPSIRRVLTAAPPPAQLLCVYRSEHWRNVAVLAEQCRSLGWPVFLHALDHSHPSLAQDTVSVGVGGRFRNLNRLAERADPGRWTIVTDDDVVLPYGGLDQMVELCRIAALDIAQPAHRADSYYNHRFTRRRPGLILRITGFVEIGPMVVFSPEAWPLVIPFPEEGMGWGTEIQWHDLRAAGLTLGILDALPLVHLGKPARSYDPLVEQRNIEALLRQRGMTDLRSLQRTYYSYGFWQGRKLSHRSAGNR